jgi:hypothetical protein
MKAVQDLTRFPYPSRVADLRRTFDVLCNRHQRFSNRVKAVLKTHRAFVFISTVTFIALMYVNQQALIYQMGLNVKENHQIYSKLVDHNRILVYNVLNLKSPVSLKKRLLAEKVELNMPRKWQVVKLESSPAKLVRRDVAKKGLFANLFVIAREAEASPNNNSSSLSKSD